MRRLDSARYRGTALFAVLVPLLSCAGPEVGVAQSDGSCRNGIMIFSPAIAGRPAEDSNLAVLDAVLLPGGEAIVSYDPDTPSAGDETSVGIKRLVQVDDSGSVIDLRLPVLDGVRVTVNAIPLVADPHGPVYFYDRDSSRVVARDSDGGWRIVIELDSSLVFKDPHPALGPGRDLYLATVSQIMRVRDGEVSIVAGARTRATSDIAFPQALPLGLPAPAVEVDLPSANAIVVGDDGTIHLVTADALFSVSPAGVFAYAGDLEGRVRLPAGSGPPNFTGLAIDTDGELLVSDSGNEHLVRVHGVQTELVADDVRFIADGTVLTRREALPLLTIDAEQQLVCRL